MNPLIETWRLKVGLTRGFHRDDRRRDRISILGGALRFNRRGFSSKPRFETGWRCDSCGCGCDRADAGLRLSADVFWLAQGEPVALSTDLSEARGGNHAERTADFADLTEGKEYFLVTAFGQLDKPG